jgi:hypothetical protein
MRTSTLGGVPALPSVAIYFVRAGVAELVDAADLKSAAASAASGFDPRLRHQKYLLS